MARNDNILPACAWSPAIAGNFHFAIEAVLYTGVRATGDFLVMSTGHTHDGGQRQFGERLPRPQQSGSGTVQSGGPRAPVYGAVLDGRTIRGFERGDRAGVLRWQRPLYFPRSACRRELRSWKS